MGLKPECLRHPFRTATVAKSLAVTRQAEEALSPPASHLALMSGAPQPNLATRRCSSGYKKSA